MANPFADKVKSTSAAKFKAMTGKNSSGQSNPNGKQDSKVAAAKNGKSDNEYKVGGTVSAPRMDRVKRASGGSVKKQEVKPLQITAGSDSDNKKTNWMRNLSEKEIAQTLGSTSRDPETGIRGHKKGGKVEAFARGGKAKGKGKGKKGTNVNITIVQPPKDEKEPIGLQPPMMPPRPPMAPPPGMEGGPGGGPPPMMPPGGMPPMKRGGVAYAKGGKVPMKGGAETGQGRLDKIKAYGKG